MPRIQAIISPEAEKLLRQHIHRKGDLSAIIENLIMERAARDRNHNKGN